MTMAFIAAVVSLYTPLATFPICYCHYEIVSYIYIYVNTYIESTALTMSHSLVMPSLWL